MTIRTAEQVQKSIEDIVKSMNSIRVEELNSILESARHEEAIGPLLDPTRFQRGGFEVVRQTKTVIQAIKDFKYAVSGIGNFNVIHELREGRQ